MILERREGFKVMCGFFPSSRQRRTPPPGGLAGLWPGLRSAGLACLILLGVLLIAPAAAAGTAETVRVAVLPFDNDSLTAPERYDAFRKSLAESFEQGLWQEGKVALAERARLQALLAEWQFQQSGLVAEDQVRRLGQLLGVEALVMGSLAVLDQQVRLDSRILAVETGAVLASAEVTGPVESIFALEQALVSQTLTAWRRKDSSRTEGGARGARPWEGGASPDRPSRWMVLPLEDLAGSGPGPEGERLARQIVHRLSRAGIAAMVERGALAPPQGDGRTLAPSGGLSGADALLLGSILNFSGQLKIYLRLVEAQQGRIIAAVAAVGKDEAAAPLTDALVERIIALQRADR
jgi:TolB-like protein